MGVIQTLRNKGGKISVVVISLALFMFLVQDALSGRNSLFGNGGDENNIGSINGSKVDYKDLENRANSEVDKYLKRNPNATSDEQMKESFRDQVWQQMIQEKVMTPQYEKLGIAVTGEEIYAMCTTEEFATDVIRKSFAGADNKFDPNTAKNFLKRLDDDPNGEVHAQWLPFEEAFTTQRFGEKYNAMAKAGIYVTSLEVTNEYQDANKKFTFQYVSQQYANFTDTTVKVTTEEAKAYFNKNKEKYKREEELRKLNYAYFDFIPSSDDTAEVRAWGNTVLEEFKKSENDSMFVLQRQGTYDGKPKTKDELGKAADSLFNASVGKTYGPYISGTGVTISKLEKIVIESIDSFKASHILIKIAGNTAKDSAEAKAQATDYMEQIKSGKSTFEIMAMLYGTDGTKEKGGDLGWFTTGSMVKEFETGVKNTPVGQMSIVLTQFGYHIVKTTAPTKKTPVKKVVVAEISRSILASQKTLDDAYNKVADLASQSKDYNSFADACKARNIQMRIADISSANKILPGLQNPKSIISWAYRAKKNEVSPLYTVEDKYVLACLKDILPEGYMTADEVTDLMTLALKEKKAQVLKDKFNENLKNAQTPEQLAISFGSVAQEIRGAVFSNSYLEYIGNEPEILATMFTLPKQKFSKPLQGQNGVYVLYMNDIIDATAPDPTMVKAQQESKANESKQRIESSVIEALKVKYKVKDLRYRY